MNCRNGNCPARRKPFQEHFFANATDEAIIAKVKELLGPNRTICAFPSNAGGGCPTHRAAAAFCNRLVQRG